MVQGGLAMASNGTDYLVAWRREYSMGMPGAVELYGARVRADGTLLDTSARVLSQDGTLSIPAIASNGTDYLVAWVDGSVLWGNRVRADGTTPDGVGRMLVTSVDDKGRPAVASDGTAYLLAWPQNPAMKGWDMMGLRLGADGVVMEGGAFTLSAEAGNEEAPALTAAGPRLLLAYQRQDLASGTRRVRARFVSFNTAPVGVDQAVSTSEDTAIGVTLGASDAEGDALTYAVASPPASGTLSGTPPNLTYTPAPQFSGTDSFTFTASDGKAAASPAKVVITVTAVNDAPVASAQSVTTA
jgi:hypothetical protein